MATVMLPVKSAEGIARTAALARTIWREHYTPIIGAEQVEYMLATYQSEKAIAEQIAQGADYFLLSHEGEDAGYCALVPETGAVMLSKLYLLHDFRKRGLATAALGFIEAYCRSHGAQSLWLTVNKNNSIAIAWYVKMGFGNTGPVTKDIGHGFVMDDFRMEKSVPKI